MVFAVDVCLFACTNGTRVAIKPCEKTKQTTRGTLRWQLSVIISNANCDCSRFVLLVYFFRVCFGSFWWVRMTFVSTCNAMRFDAHRIKWNALICKLDVNQRHIFEDRHVCLWCGCDVDVSKPWTTSKLNYTQKLSHATHTHKHTHFSVFGLTFNEYYYLLSAMTHGISYTNLWLFSLCARAFFFLILP